MKQEEHKQRFSLTLLFAAVVFCILVVSLLIAAAAVYALVWLGVIPGIEETGLSITQTILFMVLISLVIGMGIAVLAGKVPLEPLNRVISQMNRLASGDYKARLSFGKIIAENPSFREMSDSFNKLAEELESTEMLRSDFINNFSHEFKTPIVSIAGFAKLLKRGNLTPQQQAEYLDIIEKESLRLSYMATNVLDLTKVENQTILTDVTEYNLSEQLRACVLLLESKWDKKSLELQLDFGEHMICANEELLKQVWINLLDNAIKFAPTGHTVQVRITEADAGLSVAVANTGSEIPEDSRKKIWGKFYQADESHAAEGNGIGLAIVKRVVELHRGTVAVKSSEGLVVFTVTLPGKN